MKRGSGRSALVASSAIIMAALIGTPAGADSTKSQPSTILSDDDLEIVMCIVNANFDCDLNQVAKIDQKLWPRVDESVDANKVRRYLPALRGPSPAEALRHYATPESSGAFPYSAK